MRDMKLERLKARIANADYHVDVDAVAEAILRRLLSPHNALGADGPVNGTGGACPAGGLEIG